MSSKFNITAQFLTSTTDVQSTKGRLYLRLILFEAEDDDQNYFDPSVSGKACGYPVVLVGDEKWLLKLDVSAEDKGIRISNNFSPHAND
jgi:hypothetical protein